MPCYDSPRVNYFHLSVGKNTSCKNAVSLLFVAATHENDMAATSMFLTSVSLTNTCTDLSLDADQSIEYGIRQVHEMASIIKRLLNDGKSAVGAECCRVGLTSTTVLCL